jgi:uncharacterized membrane protein
MAGIGIELRKLTNKASFFSFLGAHLYAGILSSGAWIISISILTLIYFYLRSHLGFTLFNIQFLVAVTYLVSSSLILSGIFQHSLNHYIADRIFDKREYRINPSFWTCILILTLLSAPLGYISSEILLFGQPLIVKLLTASSFVTLNIIWLFSNALAGLKDYRIILFSFLLTYLIIFILAINLFQFQLAGLLFAFYVGHVLLLTVFLIFIVKQYPSRRLFRSDIIDFMKKNSSLVYGGLFFYLGIWIDKYCFWLNPETSMAVLGSLRASSIYDMPNFISFILIVPGIAMFFYEIEVNFARYYERYYDAIREGGTLHEINEKHSELVLMARLSLLNAMKVQVVVALIAILLAPEILRLLNLAPIYVYLLRVNIVSASLLTLFIGQLNLLYYLNMFHRAFYLTLIFFLLNLSLTLLSMHLGPWYLGYGFALSLLCSTTLAMIMLNRSFEKLTYTSFMTQPP